MKCLTPGCENETKPGCVGYCEDCFENIPEDTFKTCPTCHHEHTTQVMICDKCGYQEPTKKQKGVLAEAAHKANAHFDRAIHASLGSK